VPHKKRKNARICAAGGMTTVTSERKQVNFRMYRYANICTQLPPAEICRRSIGIVGSISVYTHCHTFALVHSHIRYFAYKYTTDQVRHHGNDKIDNGIKHSSTYMRKQYFVTSKNIMRNKRLRHGGQALLHKAM